MATYNDGTSYSPYVRKAAKRPGTTEPLLDPSLSTFWTEHSERATLPTGLALLRTAKEERDMLGRWKPDGSDTYIRMYNGVVARLQQQYAKAVRVDNRTGLLDERDVIESAMSWLTDRCEQLPENQVQLIISHLEDSMRWQVQPGWELTGQVEEEDVPEDTQSVPNAQPLQVQKQQTEKETRKPLYVVVNSGRRCRRLHKSQGGCWMGREMSFKSSVEFYQMPEESAYSHVCKVCWPKTSVTEALEGSSSSSSTSSSDSASSSEDQEGTD